MSVSSTIFTSVANYSCNNGYTLTGDDMRMCFENGLWSDSEPICTGLGSIINIISISMFIACMIQHYSQCFKIDIVHIIIIMFVLMPGVIRDCVDKNL